MTAIHYFPQDGLWTACGIGDPVRSSANTSEVTCRNCIITRTFRDAVPLKERPPKAPRRPVDFPTMTKRRLVVEAETAVAPRKVRTTRSPWHSETWEEVRDTLRDHFEALGFKVAINELVRTVTISHGQRAVTLMDTTEGHFDHENRLVVPHLARD